MLPDELRERALGLSLAAPPSQPRPAIGIDVAGLRRCVREQRKVRLAYHDLKDAPTERVVWTRSLPPPRPSGSCSAGASCARTSAPSASDRIAAIEHLDERYRADARAATDRLPALGLATKRREPASGQDGEGASGEAEPFSTLGQVRMTPVAGTLSRLAMTSIW